MTLQSLCSGSITFDDATTHTAVAETVDFTDPNWTVKQIYSALKKKQYDSSTDPSLHHHQNHTEGFVCKHLVPEMIAFY